MKVIAYARVSKDKSGEAKSVTEQMSEIHTVAEQEGWTIAAEYSENSVGA